MKVKALHLDLPLTESIRCETHLLHLLIPCIPRRKMSWLCKRGYLSTNNIPRSTVLKMSCSLMITAYLA